MKEDFNKLIDEYREIFNKERINTNILATNNIYEKCLELTPDSRKKEIIDKKEWIKSLNGTIVVPETIDEPINLLILENYIKESEDNNFSWIGTFCHDLTHAYDFIDIMKKLNIIEYSALEKNDAYSMFSYWTEFNARRKGYFFVRKYSFKDMYDENQMQDIVNKELPYHISNYFEEYNKNSNDANIQIYHTMQFLGRLKTWKDLFPNYFTYGFLIQLFGDNEWLLELFEFLDKNDDIDKIVKNIGQMKEILKLNFKME